MSNEQSNLIEAINRLTDTIDTTKPNQYTDYNQILVNIILSLKEINDSNREYLDKINHELKILNKTIIMAALLISAIKNPEKTLNEYQKIIEQYLG